MKLVTKPLLGIVAIFFVILPFSGCSIATPIFSEWRNPAYSSGNFKQIMVGGPRGYTSVRRSFEDEFVLRLPAAGVDALASYRYIPEDQGIDENKLREAAQKTRADAVLFPQSLQAQQKTKIGPTFPSLSLGIFGSNAGASWSGLPGAATASRYTEYTSEGTLYDVAKSELVWTGAIKTTGPENVQKAIKSYVETVMKALEAQKLIPER